MLTSFVTVTATRHHMTNAQLQQVWNTLKLWHHASMGCMLVKGIFACVSVSATVKASIKFWLTCDSKVAVGCVYFASWSKS